jgi:hypothetical protein
MIKFCDMHGKHVGKEESKPFPNMNVVATGTPRDTSWWEYFRSNMPFFGKAHILTMETKSVCPHSQSGK